VRGLGSLLRPRAGDFEAATDGGGMPESSFTMNVEGKTFALFPGAPYRGGMEVPGAWRSAVLLSDLIGAVPWNAFRERAGQPIEKLDPTPPLLEQPSFPDTRMTTFSSWALDLIWHGNAVGVIAARNRDGYPTATVPVAADQVGVRRAQRNDPVPTGLPVYEVGGRKYGPEDVIHIKGPCQPGALRGFGVLEAHLVTLALARELSQQTRSVNKNHGVPTGLIKREDPELDEAKATVLKRKWMEAQETRTPAVVNAYTDFTPLSWKPDDMQLVEARKFTLHELALIFGLPLSFLGVESSNRTYRNDETEGINLVKFSLGGHLQRFEQTLTLHFPRGTWVKANLDWVLRADTLSRDQAHKIGLDAGFLHVDEVRQFEDRPPRDDLPQPKPTEERPGVPIRT
jgi:HK97 family phage portal protein